MRLFRRALERCSERGSCINKVVEVGKDENIIVYELPEL